MTTLITHEMWKRACLFRTLRLWITNKKKPDEFIHNALLTLSIRSSSGFPPLIYQCPDAPDTLSERFGQSVRRPRTDCPKPPDTWCERQIATVLQLTEMGRDHIYQTSTWLILFQVHVEGSFLNNYIHNNTLNINQKRSIINPILNKI